MNFGLMRESTAFLILHAIRKIALQNPYRGIPFLVISLVYFLNFWRRLDLGLGSPETAAET